MMNMNRSGAGRTLWRDQGGQTTLEWTLLLATIGLPAIVMFAMMLATLTEYYRMVVYLVSVPMP
jgi:Flp pilus assembly pilin Flp